MKSQSISVNLTVTQETLLARASWVWRIIKKGGILRKDHRLQSKETNVGVTEASQPKFIIMLIARLGTSRNIRLL